jgi:hypothetical protein
MLALSITAGVAALSLTACGGGSKPQGDQPTGSDANVPPIATAQPEPVGGPLPKVEPSQVRKLVGTWKNTAKIQVQDIFTFKSDGTGTWDVGGRNLWTGQLIPAGGSDFRLSWLGKDPKVGNYWAVTLNGDGKMVFQGNQQTYAKG